MNSPTGGSSVPTVSETLEKLGYPYELVDNIPMGRPAFRLVANVEPLDARIKCGKCDCVTHHTGVALATNNSEVAGHAVRVYACTVCGVITTKRA